MDHAEIEYLLVAHSPQKLEIFVLLNLSVPHTTRHETQYPPSLYHYVTKEDQISAIKKAAEYLKTEYGIQLIGEYADTNLYGVCSLGVTWDWWASLNINQMEVAPYIACGGRDGTHDEIALTIPPNIAFHQRSIGIST